MKMYDLGAGLKGASQAMKERGWEVITLDIDPSFHCDITADVRTWHYTDIVSPDLLWFSMPCDEFSRESMPWCKTGKAPDISLIQACLRIRDEMQPLFWVCENVKGSINYLNPLMGKYRFHAGPFYLWGFFPPLGKVNMSTFRKKESYSSTWSSERAMIPYAISNAIAEAIETQESLMFHRQSVLIEG
jgi:hypothetical protein